jgi:L,D-peptidoglycan transpeptidase YkuD (ErfK/YbiS/YcfS/YnhG family)
MVGQFRFRCALGRSGIRAVKREGDSATPMGTWPLRRIYLRADHGTRPRTKLESRAIRPNDGWCDASADANYNRLIRHPYPASAERMWREDQLYDIVVVLGHNDRPRMRGCGSAIFMHLARPGYRATEGCIALARRDLVLLLSRVGPRTRLRIG